MLTPHQIELVQSSFARTLPHRARLSRRFYEQFFELVPETRDLFPASMVRQNDKIMSAMVAIVRSLDSREKLAALAQGLADKHNRPGINMPHFPIMANALIAAMGDTLGPDAFGPEVAQAWHRAFAEFIDLVEQNFVSEGDKPESPGRVA